MRTAVLALLCLLVAANAECAYLQGSELKDYLDEYLKDKSGQMGNPVKAGMYVGYVAGAIDALNGIALCLPDATPLDEVVRRVTDYVNGHPESRRWSARYMVFEALKPVFPCSPVNAWRPLSAPLGQPQAPGAATTRRRSLQPWSPADAGAWPSPPQ